MALAGNYNGQLLTIYNDDKVSVTLNANTVTVQYYDVTTGEMHAIEAKQCILATPQFVNNRLLAAEKSRSELVTKHLQLCTLDGSQSFGYKS